MGRRRHALGQHFLNQPSVVERILDAAGPGPGDTVLEIGPGMGALTEGLLARGARVVAVEADRRMVAALQRRWGGDERLGLHHADATQVDLGQWGPYTKIVSNLPYSVSTPLTFRFLELDFSEAVLMYQQEFARRMVARTGSPDYGRLAVALARVADVELLFRVPRGAFSPPPKVDSHVVRLRPLDTPRFPTGSCWEQMVRSAFSHRRKMLRSSLGAAHAALGASGKNAVLAVLADLGWDRRRPEELTPEDLGRLSVRLEEAVRAG